MSCRSRARRSTDLVADVRAALRSAGERPDAKALAGGDDPKARRPLGNLKARLRMSTLYFVGELAELSRRRHRQPQRADDRLLHQVRRRRRRPAADRHLLKGEVRDAGARARRARSDYRQAAEPPVSGSARPTKQEMGFKYTDLERYVIEGPDAVSPALAMRIERLVRASDHKRALAREFRSFEFSCGFRFRVRSQFRSFRSGRIANPASPWIPESRSRIPESRTQ